MEIRLFEEGDVAGAAELVAARYARGRRREPLLHAGYEYPETCAHALGHALVAGATGLVASGERGVEGFLLAVPGDDVRGLHVWSGLESHGYSDDPDVLRRLYSELAGGWVAEGRGHHFVVAGRAEVEKWLSLGFAYEQVHGIRSTNPDEKGYEGLDIRRAGPDDVDALEPLFPLIGEAHRVAPTLAFIERGFFDELRDGHLELLRDPSVGYWLAEAGDGVLGYATLRPVPDDEASMLRSKGVVELTVAATTPAARGRGVMGALLGRSLRWARKEGFEVCVTDWRAANLDSSQAWPRLGFRPFAYRLHRIVDPRLLP